MSQGTDETTEAPPSSDQLEMTKRLRRLRLQAAGGEIDDQPTSAPPESRTEVEVEPEVDHDHLRRIREQSDHPPAPRIPAAEPPEPDLTETDSGGNDDSAEAELEVPAAEPTDSDDRELDVEADAGSDPVVPDAGAEPDLEAETGAGEKTGTATEPVEDPDLLGAAATLPVLRTGSREKRSQKAARQTEAAETADTPAIRRNDDAAQGEIVQVFEAHHAVSVNVRDYVKDIWTRRKFLAALAKSDIKGRRSSTYFGAVWGLLDPMFQSGIYFFVFIIIRGGQGGRPVEFLPLLIGGVFLYRLFTAALSEGGKSVRRSTSLMLNANFPRALLPLSTVYKGLLEFAPTVFIYVLIYAFLGPSLQQGLLILPLLFVIQTILGAGVALLASTLVVFFQDVENLLRYVQRLLFFTTPIIFPVDKIPEAMIPYLRFNPLFGLFYSYQTVLGGGTAPTEYVVQAAVWAVVMLGAGTWVFLRFERAMASKL